MKTKVMMLSMMILALAILISLQLRPAAADDPTPAVIQAIENGQMETLLAEATQEGGYDLNAIYEELKQLGKQYKRADSRDAKGRIVTRAEELMGQLFDAKLQKEKQRIEVMQRRLDDERHKVAGMEEHKWDLVKEGTQKALNGEPLPEWATQGR